MTNRRTAAAAAMAGLVLLFAGCDATPQPAPSTPAANPTTPAPTPSATVAATDDPACLVGTWTLDEEGMGQYYAQINDLLEGAAEFTPRGDATLTIGADGTFTWQPDAQISALVAGREMEVSLSGTLGGTYTAEPGHILTDADVDDDLVVTGTVDGSAVDASAIAQQIGGAPMTDSAFACTPDTLDLTTTIADSSVTTTLTRAD
jgi:hypothetical protein